MINLFRIAALAATASFCLLGCAEFRQRGGFVAQVQDYILFPAYGKGHRVLRSYVMIGAMVTIARNSGLPPDELQTLAARMNESIGIAREAFTCAYESRDGCPFLDEKMSRLDYQLYKLAVLVLSDPESRELASEVRDKLIGAVPVVTPIFKGFVHAAEAANETANAASQATAVIESLLKIGYIGGKVGAKVFPLWRDAVEIDFMVVLDGLARRCDASVSGQKRYNLDEPNRAELFARLEIDRTLITYDSCRDFYDGYAIYSAGNGNFAEWRQFSAERTAEYRYEVSPTADHFLAVTRVIWDACGAVFGNQFPVVDVCRGRKANVPVRTSPKDPVNFLTFNLLYVDLIRSHERRSRADLSGLRLSRQPLPSGAAGDPDRSNASTVIRKMEDRGATISTSR